MFLSIIKVVSFLFYQNKNKSVGSNDIIYNNFISLY